MKKSGFIAAFAFGAMPLFFSIAGAASPTAVSWPRTLVSVEVEIVGEVAKPGYHQFKLGDKPTLLNLVSASGGLTRDPARVHVKVRRDGRSLDIDIEDLMNLKVDFTLQEGDRVTISSHRVFIGGAVKNSDDYNLPDNGTLSVAEALALAGGPIEAEGNRVTLLLASKNAKLLDRFSEILPADFNRLLQDGDSLYVSNPKVKRSSIAPNVRITPRPYNAPKPQVRARLYLLNSNLAP